MTASREIDAHNTAKIIVYGNVFERNWYIRTRPPMGRCSRPARTFAQVQCLWRHAATPIQIFALWIGSADHLRRAVSRGQLTDITGIRTAGSKINRTTNNADLESVAYATYTETAIRLTEAFTISPGIRWEQVNQSRETMNAVPLLEEFQELQDDTRTDLRDGVKYQLTPDSMLFGHVHTTFRPPTFANAVDPTSGTHKTSRLSAH